MEKKYKHAEAFRIMTYKCEQCGKEERIWNSRDGVTPFIIGCRYCDGEAEHVRWHEDTFNADYKPKSGERIFTDYTEKTAKAEAKRILKIWEGTQNELPKKDHEKFIKEHIEHCKMNTNVVKVR